MALTRGTAMVVALLLLAAGTSAAKLLPYDKVDLDEFLTETQKGSPDPNRLLLIDWTPVEYWAVVLAQDPTVSKEDREEFIEGAKSHTLIGVADGHISAAGGVTYRSEAWIRSRLRVKDAKGRYYYPLQTDELPSDVRVLLASMGPMMAALVGELGENMHFFAFPNQDSDGKRIDDPRGKGRFLIILGSEEYSYRLPLGSLLAKKTCPTCREKHSGAFSYCPYDGAKLPEPN